MEQLVRPFFNQEVKRYHEDVMTITAKFEDGVFKPLERVSIEEGTVVEVLVPMSKEPVAGKRRSVREFAFTGMWKDREEMADSVDYVNTLRKNLR